MPSPKNGALRPDGPSAPPNWGGGGCFPHAQRALSDGPIVRNPLSLVPALVARTASTSEAGT